MSKEDVLEVEGTVQEACRMQCSKLSLKTVTKYWRTFRANSECTL